MQHFHHRVVDGGCVATVTGEHKEVCVDDLVVAESAPRERGGEGGSK